MLVVFGRCPAGESVARPFDAGAASDTLTEIAIASHTAPRYR